MNKIRIFLLLLITSFITGCTGPGEMFEARVYGVRQSVWDNLTTIERNNAMQAYTRKQERLAEQARLEALREEKRLARQRRLNAMEERINLMAEDTYNRYERDYGNPNENYFYNHSDYNRLSYDEKKIYKNKIRELRRRNARLQQDRLNAERRKNRLRHEQETQRRRETQDIAEAKRKSMQTYRQEQARRQQNRQLQEQRRQETRDIAEAKRRSMQTYRQEQRARNRRAEELRRQEARDLAEAKRRSMQTYRQEQKARQKPKYSSPKTQTSSSKWRMNEGHMVKGGRLIMDLQRDIGRQPTKSEMVGKLKSGMNVTTSQANQIIDSLGLY